MTDLVCERAVQLGISIDKIVEPETMLIHSRIRALFGLALVLLGCSACIALLVLVVFQEPIAGLAFGLSAAAFVLVTRAGAKYAQTEPQSKWRAIVGGNQTN